jgi:cell wall-associated NlpC family hydrolase
MIADSNRLFCNAVFTAIAASCLAGCAGTAAVETKPAEVSVAGQAPASIQERAAAVALKQVGTAYRYGGSSPAGFDCSGLVQYSYLEAGKTVPRTTSQLWNTAGTVPYDDLQVGDLLFFRFDGKMSHVGIYVGDEKFVHAPSTGRSVTVDSLDARYYRSALMRAGRLR